MKLALILLLGGLAVGSAIATVWNDLPLLGRGRNAAVLTFTPPTLNFGDVEIGTQADMNSTARNAGQAPISGTIALRSDCPAFGYSVVAGGGSYTLAPGQTRVVTVRFTPVDTLSHPCVLLSH